MKRFNSFIFLLLITTVLFLGFFSNGCNGLSTPAVTETETETQAPITAATTTISNEPDEDSHAETPLTDDAQILPLSDISCILGYWDVETDSLLNAANSLVSANSVIIFTRVEPHIIYAFYEGDLGIDTTKYRMDIWYDNVLLTANVQGSAGSEPDRTIDMRLNGVLTSEIISEREGQIVYRPIESENSLEITEMWLDGNLMSDGPMNISDMADTNVARDFLFDCLGNGRLKLTYSEGEFYLSATTRAHD